MAGRRDWAAAAPKGGNGAAIEAMATVAGLKAEARAGARAGASVKGAGVGMAVAGLGAVVNVVALARAEVSAATRRRTKAPWDLTRAGRWRWLADRCSRRLARAG